MGQSAEAFTDTVSKIQGRKLVCESLGDQTRRHSSRVLRDLRSSVCSFTPSLRRGPRRCFPEWAGLIRAKVLATEPMGLEQIMRRAQLVKDIATAVHESRNVTIDRTTKVNAVANRAMAKPPETTATCTVTLSSKPTTTTTTSRKGW